MCFGENTKTISITAKSINTNGKYSPIALDKFPSVKAAVIRLRLITRNRIKNNDEKKSTLFLEVRLNLFTS